MDKQNRRPDNFFQVETAKFIESGPCSSTPTLYYHLLYHVCYILSFVISYIIIETPLNIVFKFVLLIQLSLPFVMPQNWGDFFG
jgi:hypothetical protein